MKDLVPYLKGLDQTLLGLHHPEQFIFAHIHKPRNFLMESYLLIQPLCMYRQPVAQVSSHFNFFLTLSFPFHFQTFFREGIKYLQGVLTILQYSLHIRKRIL